MTKRAKKVLSNYTLKKEGDLFIATDHMYGYADPVTISGTCIEQVKREARCAWGHMNHRDEAAAFNSIFGPDASAA